MSTQQSELLDTYDSQGNPLGIKERELVHRDGDWHNTVICFISYEGADGEHYLIFQERSPNKDLYPNKLGASVAGHCLKGETPFKTLLKELKEELNIKNISSPVIYIGVKQSKNIFPDRKKDCEFQHIYHILYDINKLKKEVKIDFQETSELISVNILDALKLFSNKQEQIKAHYCITKTSTSKQVLPLSKFDFVPFPDKYYYLLLRLILRGFSQKISKLINRNHNLNHLADPNLLICFPIPYLSDLQYTNKLSHLQSIRPYLL